MPIPTDLYLRGIMLLTLVSGYNWVHGATIESGGICLKTGCITLLTNSLNVTPYKTLNIELSYQSHEYSNKLPYFSRGRLWLALVRHTGTTTQAERNLLISRDLGFAGSYLSLSLANISITSRFFMMFGLRGYYSEGDGYSNHYSFSNMGGINDWIY